MKIFCSRVAIVLLVLVSELAATCAFQSKGIRHHATRRPPAFCSRQREYARGNPLQAAFITELAGLYSYGMAKYYLATQSFTGGVLCGVGDAVAQVKERLFEKENKKLDFTSNAIDLDRVLRFALKGFGGGLIWSQWYGLADEWSLQLSNDFLNMIGNDVVFSDGIHRAARTIAAILLEQFVACPIVYSLWDIPFPMLMNGASIESVPAQVRTKIGPLLMENAKVWSFVNIIIYNIPVEYRLVAMSTADVFWQSVIASVAASAAADADDKNKEAPELPYVQKSSGPSKRKAVARLTE